MRTLIVDDDPNLVSVWRDLFQLNGHQCDTSFDLSGARRQIMAKNYDLIILDLFIGTESGLGIATLAGYMMPLCEVVLVTDTPLFPRGELFTLAPGVSTVLRKPVEPEVLLAICEHHAHVEPVPHKVEQQISQDAVTPVAIRA